MPTLRYLGHSCCEVSAGDTRVLIDPFITGNQKAAVTADELEPTAILLSHAHNDHVGDTISIARRTGAIVVTAFELASWLEQQGLATHGMGIGGAHQFPWGWVKLTQAWHSSSYTDEQGNYHALGTPSGLLLRLDGKLIYHAGDTALFGDMALIARHGIDVALLPIGDNYTMGLDDAVEAVKLLKPRTVIPIHYDTFPVIEQDACGWAKRVEAETNVKAEVLTPGQSLDL